MKVVEIVVEQVNGAIPVIAGAGSNNTIEAIEFTKHAQGTGANAASAGVRNCAWNLSVFARLLPRPEFCIPTSMLMVRRSGTGNRNTFAIT